MSLSVPITFQSDEKGFFDRECPNEECGFTFKVLMNEWFDNYSDDAVYCPMCGCASESTNWNTEEQINQIQNIVADYALSMIQSKFNKSFSKLERSTRHNKFVRFKYTPSKKVTFVNNPVGQSEEWEQEIVCEKCGVTFSVIGSAYFCPCCGYNSASSSFEKSIECLEKMLDSTSEMRELFTEKYGVDEADAMCRSLVEGGLGDCVSAFQKFAQCKYYELTGKDSRVNDFQIVEKGNKLFTQDVGHSYNEWIDEDELYYMNLFFQRRHLIEHNAGIVDQKYIDKSSDALYKVGQRVVVKINNVFELINIIKKISKGLNEL